MILNRHGLTLDILKRILQKGAMSFAIYMFSNMYYM